MASNPLMSYGATLEFRKVSAANASMKNFHKIGFPKRVGLVSFYLFDSGTYSKKYGLNPKGANQFSSEFAKRSVPPLKKQFAEYGMELLTPIEFLETDQQREAYLGFVLPQGKLQSATMAIQDFLGK